MRRMAIVILSTLLVGQTVVRRYGDDDHNITFYDDGTVVVTPGISTTWVGYTQIYANGGTGIAETINWLNGNIQKCALTDDCTFTLTNPLIGVHQLFINVGMFTYSMTWPANVVWRDSSAPTATANRMILCEFYYNGTNYYGKWGDYY